METTTKRGVGRPKLPEKDRKVYINFMAHPMTRRKLKSLAKGAKLSTAKFLTELIDRHPYN